MRLLIDNVGQTCVIKNEMTSEGLRYVSSRRRTDRVPALCFDERDSVVDVVTY